VSQPADIEYEKVYASRPTTLLRALPSACVKEMAGSRISGITSEEMMKDIDILKKYRRMATILDIEYKYLYLNDIAPLALPFLKWIYIETVQKPNTINHSQYNASRSPYQKTARFIITKTKTFVKYKSYVCTASDEFKITL